MLAQGLTSGDVIIYKTNQNNPNERSKYANLLFIAPTETGFFAIKGYDVTNVTGEAREKLDKLGIILNEDNSNFSVDMFFGYNLIKEYSYEYIKDFRCLLRNKEKTMLVENLIKSHDEQLTPDGFRLNDFLQHITYRSEKTEEKPEITVIDQIDDTKADTVSENNKDNVSGVVRTRTEILVNSSN